MNRLAVFFLLFITPILAILLALLGIKTLPTNPLGWFLLFVGVIYSVGMVIIYFIKKEHFWESSINETNRYEEQGDLSFWFITLGMLIVFYTSPIEYLFLSALLPRNVWMSFSGVVLVTLGSGLFVWARRTLKKNYSGHVSVKNGQILVQSGPYRFIRHPAYGGYFLMALGISIGFSSLIGGISILALLLPALVYRIKVEEKLLVRHFGLPYQEYVSHTNRLIPFIW